MHTKYQHHNKKLFEEERGTHKVPGRLVEGIRAIFSKKPCRNLFLGLPRNQWPFEWGKKQGLIPRDCINPFAEIEKKPHESEKPRPAPIDSVIRAYLVATPDQKDLLLTYLATGARKSEILKMNWDDIDFENRIYALHTRKSRSRTLKTTYHVVRAKLNM